MAPGWRVRHRGRRYWRARFPGGAAVGRAFRTRREARRSTQGSGAYGCEYKVSAFARWAQRPLRRAKSNTEQAATLATATLTSPISNGLGDGTAEPTTWPRLAARIPRTAYQAR